MGWQRFNRGTNVFEVSDDNGASWQTLVIAAGGLALGGNLAYTDRLNTFTAGQDFISDSGTNYDGANIELRSATPRISFHVPGVIASQLGVETDGSIVARDNPGTGYAPFKAATITATTSQWMGNILTNGGYIYPGRIDVAGAPAQGSWLLAGHGSYGLYSNTGIYAAGPLWSGAGVTAATSIDAQGGILYGRVGCRIGLDAPNGSGLYTWFEESSNHIRAAGGLYDYSRGTPIAHWTNFTPTLANCALSGLYCCKWMVVGKTMWLSFNLALTSMANVNALAMLLPAGMYNAGEYTTQAFIYYDQQTIGYGMAQCSPNDVYIYFYKNILANLNWLNSGTIAGSLCIPIL